MDQVFIQLFLINLPEFIPARITLRVLSRIASNYKCYMSFKTAAGDPATHYEQN